MRKEDLELLRLICPSCRRIDSSGKLVEGKLSLGKASRISKGRIVSGEMSCEGCGRKYPIQEGVLCLLERPRGTKRKISPITEAYLKASYGKTDNKAYWKVVSRLFPKGGNTSKLSVDLGCGVGRATFELARKSKVAVGIDVDFEGLALAERFAREGKIEYSFEERKLAKIVEKSPIFPEENSVFVLGNALDPPFSAKSAGIVFAGNLVDSVSNPRLLLEQICALLSAGGSLVLTTPFSWKEDVTPRERWLESKGAGGEKTLRKFLKRIGMPILREIPETEWTIPARKRMRTVFSCYAVSAQKEK